MRKGLVIAASSIFFYGLLRDMTLLKTLILCAAIGSSYAISKVPVKYLVGAKYPMIGMSLLLPVVLIIYPWIRHHWAIVALTVVVAFYGIALFLVTMDEKDKKMYKEVTGVCLVYAASFTSLFLTGLSSLILPLSVSMLLFLFIANKMKMIPFAGGLAVAGVVTLLVSGVHMFSTAQWLNPIERYVVMGAAFVLLLISFVGFVKKPDFVNILCFFGLIFVSVDLLMSLGFRFAGLLLAQPGLALFVVGPIVGVAMKGEKERL